MSVAGIVCFPFFFLLYLNRISAPEKTVNNVISCVSQNSSSAFDHRA